MTLPASGPIKFSDINVELGRPPNQPLAWSDPALRTLAEVPSGPLKMSDFSGKSSVPAIPTMAQAFGTPVGQIGGKNVYQIPEQPLYYYSLPNRPLNDSLKELVIMSQQRGFPLTATEMNILFPPDPVATYPGSNTVSELVLMNDDKVISDPAGQYIAYHRHALDTEYFMGAPHTGPDWIDLSDQEAYERIMGQELKLPLDSMGNFIVTPQAGFKRQFEIVPYASHWLLAGSTFAVVPDLIAD